MEPQNNSPFPTISIPTAIIAAGIIVALAIIFTGQNTTVGQQANQVASPEEALPIEKIEKISFRPISSNDHILGSPDAKIFIIEYSDLECPFCKQFHYTMKKVLEEYGESGKVAWVYRHFPLNIHPKAQKEAEAAECAGEIGGEVKFWEFTDRLFEITPSNNGLDPTLLPQIAEYVGLDAKAFSTCLASGKYAEKVKKDLEDALSAGAQGTPFSIIATKTESIQPLRGALPFESIKETLDEILKQN